MRSSSSVRLWGYLVAVFVLLSSSSTVFAFPLRFVLDNDWGQSAPWLTFTVPAGAELREGVRVATTVTRVGCMDPVRRVLCGIPARPKADVVTHIFSAQTGRAVTAAQRCSDLDRSCLIDTTLVRGMYGIFVHGGPESTGITDVRVTVTLVRHPGRVILDRTVRFSGRAFDVRSPPQGTEQFDVHSVLVADGPTNVDEVTGDIAGSEGNVGNDWLGVDATEAWLFDANFNVIEADLAMSGVGPAGLIRDAHGRGDYPTAYVLVRPYSRPPFSLTTVRGTPIDIDADEYPIAPGSGRMRVVINPRPDADGDRLGDEVEAELGLCDGLRPVARGRLGDPQASPVACHTAFEVQVALALRVNQRHFLMSDPRDTDGDGISDGAEVLGTDVVRAKRGASDDTYPTPADRFEQITEAAQTLPQWGFDPLHKDMLIELDRFTTETVCRSPTDGCAADRRVYPMPIPGQADYSAEQAFESLWSWRRAWASIPAVRANNPDGRDGIELHFDVRFAATRTASHGVIPAIVPRRPTSGAIFGKPGLIAYVPLGNAGGRCSCGRSQVAPDPRHGGLSRYGVGFPFFTGQNSCDQDIQGYAVDPEATIAHEFGHVMGLAHGGARPDCFGSAFAPLGAFDTGREDKIAYASHMNYTFGTHGAALLRNRDAMGGHVFSIGRTLASPVPRRVTRGDATVFGWPEDLTFDGASTAHLALWLRPSGGNPAIYRPMSRRGASPPDGVDFDFDNAASDAVPTAMVEPGQPFEAGATYLAKLSGQMCDNGNYPPSDTTTCCPFGSTLVGSVCRIGGGAGTIVPASTPVLQSLFNVARQGPFIARPEAGVPRRMYALHSADRGATDTAGTVTRAWTGFGKVRWQAMDFVVPAASAEFPNRYEVSNCSSDHHDCSNVRGGRAQRGDFIVDGQPWAIHGPGTISAATIEQNVVTDPEVILAGVSSRACMFRTDPQSNQETQCDWTPARFAIGTGANLESTTPGFRSVVIANGPPGVAGIAVTRFRATADRPSEFLVVVASADLAMFVRPSITAQMIRFIRGNYREFCRNQ
jgi:hypothetical protein